MSGNKLFIILLAFMGIAAGAFLMSSHIERPHYIVKSVKMYHSPSGQLSYRDDSDPNIWWYLHINGGPGITVRYDDISYRAVKGPPPSGVDEQHLRKRNGG